MAKFTITFVFNAVQPRSDEEVSADYFEDHPPFVDFKITDEADPMSSATVARYRADDIRKITRED